MNFFTNFTAIKDASSSAMCLTQAKITVQTQKRIGASSNAQVSFS